MKKPYLLLLMILGLTFVSGLNIGNVRPSNNALDIISPNTCSIGNYSYGFDPITNMILCRSDQLGGGSSSANVSSVTSANGYITSSPTTGNVVLTFNGAVMNTTIDQRAVNVGGDTMTGPLNINIASGVDWLIGLISGTPWFRCGTSVFGVVSCTSSNNNALYLGNDDASSRMVFADAGELSFVGGNRFIDFYLGAYFTETNRFQINDTAIRTLQTLDLEDNQIVSFFDNDCPTGNYSYGIGTNGTLKCANDQIGVQSKTIFFNNSHTVGGAFLGTSTSTAQQYGMFWGGNSLSTGYGFRHINITENGFIERMWIRINTRGSDVTFQLYQNGTAVPMSCVIVVDAPASGAKECLNETQRIPVNIGDTIAMGYKQANATATGNVMWSFRYVVPNNITI